MPHASRPFGARAIASFSRLLKNARLSLTAIYVVLLAIILAISTSVTYSAFSSRLDTRFQHIRPAPGTIVIWPLGPPPDPEQVREDLLESFLFTDGVLLVIAALVGYWLAGITLQPIEEAAERQRRFVSDASHEMRTPLTILQTDLENELSVTTDTTTRERATSQLEEVERMGRLVTDLLTLSRLDEAATPEVWQDVSLNELMQEAATRFQAIAERQQVILTVDLPVGKDLRIRTNKELLLQALSNVIKNAIAYNRPQGTVTLILRQHGREMTLAVRDTGPGISQEHQRHIFDRFYRADESRSRQTGGSGLGLSIVQSIMEQLHGSVDLESKLDEGTTVTLHLFFTGHLLR